MNDIIVSTVPAILIVGVVSLSLVLFMLAVYDLIFGNRGAQSKQFSLSTITVIVMNTGSVDVLKNCLKSVRASRYRKLDTVVVGFSSRHSSPALSKELTKKYTHIRHYQPRKKYSYNKLIQEAYKLSERGSIVVVIDSHLQLPSGILSAIAHRRGIIEGGEIIRLQSRSDTYGFMGVVVSLKASTERIYEKLSSVLHIPMPTMQLGRGYALPANIVTNKIKNNLYNYSSQPYDNLEVVSRPQLGVVNVRAARTKYIARLLGFAAIIFIASIIIQSAIQGSGVEMLTMSWLLIAVSAMLIVLFDAHISLRQKIEAVVCFGFMPILVLIAYATSIKHEASR